MQDSATTQRNIFIYHNSRGEEVVDPSVEAEAERIAREMNDTSTSISSNSFTTFKQYSASTPERAGNDWRKLSFSEKQKWKKVREIQKRLAYEGSSFPQQSSSHNRRASHVTSVKRRNERQRPDRTTRSQHKRSLQASGSLPISSFPTHPQFVEEHFSTPPGMTSFQPEPQSMLSVPSGQQEAHDYDWTLWQLGNSSNHIGEGDIASHEAHRSPLFFSSENTELDIPYYGYAPSSAPNYPAFHYEPPSVSGHLNNQPDEYHWEFEEYSAVTLTSQYI